MRKSLIVVSIVVFLFSNIGNAQKRDVYVGIASNFTKSSQTSVNPYGNGFRSGIDMAVKKVSHDLDQKGLRVKLVEFDYGGDPIMALKSSRLAISSPVVTVIGYNASTEALLVGPAFQENRLPLILPTATSSRLFKIGNFIHPMAVNNNQMAEYMAKTAMGFDAKKAVIIFGKDCAYCTDLSSWFKKAYIQRGGSVVLEVAVLTTDRQFDSLIDSLHGLSYDVVVLPNHELLSSRIIRAMLDDHLNPLFIGGDGWENADGKILLNLTKDSNFKGYYITDWHSDEEKKLSKKFVREYQMRFHEFPNDDAVLGYDSFLFFSQALLNASSIDRAGIQNAMSQISQFNGVSGKILWSREREMKKMAVLVRANSMMNKLEYVKIMDPEN